MSAALQRVIARHDLARREAYDVLRLILAGGATNVQIAALLVALAMKGESVDEIVGFATAMREEAAQTGIARAAVVTLGTGRDALIPAPMDANGTLVDTCGTGGDACGTFNISTATALVVAGAGVPVAKHGNRSISSRCGSADVMEALGVNINLPPERLGECLHKVGMAFLFAPLLHMAMRFVQPVRRELRVRTIFNLLGPLTNPAGARAQVVGVYAFEVAEKIAAALAALGTRRAFVVHSEDGLDEISTTAPTRVAEVHNAQVRTWELNAADYGFPRVTLANLAGGNAQENARAIRAVLDNEPGARRDIVMINAAAAILVADRAADLGQGLRLAAESIASGSARRTLERLVEFTNRPAQESRALP